MMQRHELEAWLGPALEQITPDEFRMLLGYARDIETNYPGKDNETKRDRMLSAAVQRLLGDDFTPAADAGEPDRIEVGNYVVVRMADGWRILERTGACRMVKRKFGTSSAAVKRATAMQAQDDAR